MSDRDVYHKPVHWHNRGPTCRGCTLESPRWGTPIYPRIRVLWGNCYVGSVEAQPGLVTNCGVIQDAHVNAVRTDKPSSYKHGWHFPNELHIEYTPAIEAAWSWRPGGFLGERQARGWRDDVAEWVTKGDDLAAAERKVAKNSGCSVKLLRRALELYPQPFVE